MRPIAIDADHRMKPCNSLVSARWNNPDLIREARFRCQSWVSANFRLHGEPLIQEWRDLSLANRATVRTASLSSILNARFTPNVLLGRISPLGPTATGRSVTSFNPLCPRSGPVRVDHSGRVRGCTGPKLTVRLDHHAPPTHIAAQFSSHSAWIRAERLRPRISWQFLRPDRIVAPAFPKITASEGRP